MKTLVIVSGISNLDEFFAKDFRTFTLLNEKDSEDRSLNLMQPTAKSSPEDSLPDIRSAVESKGRQEGEPILLLCYKLIIAPVAEFFEEPEIIIVPDRSLTMYKVPFARYLTKVENAYQRPSEYASFLL